MHPQESATDFSNIALVWRGALGGVLGAPVFLVAFVLYEKRTTGYVAYGGALSSPGSSHVPAIWSFSRINRKLV